VAQARGAWALANTVFELIQVQFEAISLARSARAWPARLTGAGSICPIQVGVGFVEGRDGAQRPGGLVGDLVFVFWNGPVR